MTANERPTETVVPVGFFFSPPDRANRLAELISCRSKVTPDELMEVLMDVFMATSIEVTRRFLAVLSSEPAKKRREKAARLVAALTEWDGRYGAQSRGALAFELIFHNFVRAFYRQDERRAYWATWAPRTLVKEDLAQSEPSAIASALKRAIRRSIFGFERFGTWGEIHRLRIGHPFGLLPMLGKPYLYCDVAMAGGNESVLKTGHRFTVRRHSATFGSSARHCSDLSDPDSNYFALAGGQDGWLGSSTYADQLDLWHRGTSIQVPLQLEAVRARFPHRLELLP